MNESDIKSYRTDMSNWDSLQLELNGHCPHSKPHTDNKITVLPAYSWGENSCPFSTKWLLDTKDANGEPEHVPAIAKMPFEQHRGPLYREILGNFRVCSSQLEIFDTVIMIFFFRLDS
jgi:hypothetical protein